jgi:CRISPR-associated protein Cst1
MLRYTGHPIADIGVATIAAFCEKPDLSSLSQEDLLKVAQFLEREYFSGKLLSYLTCVFPNSAYVQPGAQPGAKVKMKPESIDRFKHQVLYAFQEPPAPEANGLLCVFSGDPACRVVYRQHVPMITGENVLNFFPAGTGGLPISGPYLLAIQTFPLGARRCYGRALAVHCPDDSGLTYAFARRFLAENRRLLLLAEKSGEKYLDAKAPKTLVVHTLLEIENERREHDENEIAPSVTVYHLTNSGQGPDIALFFLPSEVIRFLRLASRAGTQLVWRRIEAAAWEKIGSAGQQSKENERGKKKRGAKAGNGEPPVWGPGISRNYLYEDVFDLPNNAASFVRTYFLRRAYRAARQQDDPRRAYRLSKELELVSWELTRLFLKEVIGMEKIRIEAIRTLGDRLADYISSDNDRRFFQGFYRTNQYGVLRNLLIKSCNARLRKGQPPLIGLDEFLLVFEEGEETPRRDWRLARDLVLIRMIEELYKKEWFGKQPDVLEGLDTDEEERNGATS